MFLQVPVCRRPEAGGREEPAEEQKDQDNIHPGAAGEDGGGVSQVAAGAEAGTVAGTEAGV